MVHCHHLTTVFNYSKLLPLCSYEGIWRDIHKYYNICRPTKSCYTVLNHALWRLTGNHPIYMNPYARIYIDTTIYTDLQSILNLLVGTKRKQSIIWFLSAEEPNKSLIERVIRFLYLCEPIYKPTHPKSQWLQTIRNWLCPGSWSWNLTSNLNHSL